MEVRREAGQLVEREVRAGIFFFLFNWRNSGSLAASRSQVPFSLRESGVGWLETSRVRLLGEWEAEAARGGGLGTPESDGIFL